jgi:hypothetical protein
MPARHEARKSGVCSAKPMLQAALRDYRDLDARDCTRESQRETKP